MEFRDWNLEFKEGRFPKPGSIPAPPLFIEEVAAKLTEEFINCRFNNFRFQPRKAHAFFIFNFQFSIFNCNVWLESKI